MLYLKLNVLIETQTKTKTVWKLEMHRFSKLTNNHNVEHGIIGICTDSPNKRKQSPSRTW